VMRPMCTVAIPPEAISSWSAYRPTKRAGAVGDDDGATSRS